MTAREDGRRRRSVQTDRVGAEVEVPRTGHLENIHEEIEVMTFPREGDVFHDPDAQVVEGGLP